MPPVRRFCLAAPLFFGSLLAPVAGAADGSGAATGAVRLASGPQVAYEYHFDRNALAASVDVPGGLVALTRSGNLLRFDPATLRRDREWIAPSRCTCLGRGAGDSVLVGAEDGRIARVDPATLALTAVATVPGRPQWVGTRRDGGIVVVVERRHWVDPQEERIERDRLLAEGGMQELEVRGDDEAGKLPALEWEPCSEVRDLASGRAFEVFQLASTFLIDREDRVWLGSQENRYEGWTRCVDLIAGRARPIRGRREPTKYFQGNDGVTTYGFFESRDGQVWAHGGFEHAISSAAIARLDGPRVRELYECEQTDLFGDAAKRRAQPDRPNQVIERIAEGLEPGSLLVFAEEAGKEEPQQTIFRTDATLGRWDRWLALDIRRTDDVHNPGDRLPVVRAVHHRGAAGELILATERDGYVRIAHDRATRDPAPDQLEADAVTAVTATAEGTFFQGADLGRPWQLRAGRWVQPALVPAGEPIAHPYRIIAGPDGAMNLVTDDATLRWRDGQVATAEHPPTEPGRAFATPDGSLWQITGKLHRFDGAKWAQVGEVGAEIEEVDRVDYLDGGEWRTLSTTFGHESWQKRRPDGVPCPVPDPKRWEIGGDCRVVNAAGPPWVVLDAELGRLMTLTHTPDFAAATLSPLAVEDGGLPLSVDDAISWSPTEILIVTRRGLRLCTSATGRHRPAPLPGPDRPVRRLARDGLNRLWLGGDGLWMIDEGGHLHDLADVPMVGRSPIAALASDPARPGGMIVALGGRGLAFLRVEAAP